MYHGANRIAAGIAGLVLLDAGGGLLIYAVVSAGGATGDSSRIPFYLVLLLPAALLLLAGAALFIAASRTVAAIAGGITGAILLLASGGVILLGFVFEQSDSAAYDRGRAAPAAWGSGAALFSMGLLLMALAVWWANSSRGRRRLHRVSEVVAFGYGGWLFVQGLLLLAYLPFIGLALAHSASAGQVNSVVLGTTLAGGALLALFPGTIFVYHGVSAYMRVPSGPLRLPAANVLALAFFLAILLGLISLATGAADTILVPPLHVIAAISAPLAILALATRRSIRRADTPGTHLFWRQPLLMMAWGMAVAATIAIILEGLALLYTILGFLLAKHDLSNARDAQALANSLSGSNTDLGKTLQLLFLLITVAALGPLIEEFSKGFGVRFLRSDRPSRYQAFIFGLASGAGFATVEAVEYGAGALSQNLNRWWDTMLLRGGSGSLHALASGIVGLAWYYFFAGRRARAAGLFLLAVGLHSGWNALNVLTDARIIPYFRDLSDRSLEIGLEVILGLIAIALIATIAILSRTLARKEEAASPADEAILLS